MFKNLTNEQYQFIAHLNLDSKLQTVIEEYITNKLNYNDFDYDFLCFAQSTLYDSKLRKSILEGNYDEKKSSLENSFQQKNINKMKNLTSYYFSFDETGIAEVDNLLYAITRAGKAFHCTSQWNDELGEFYSDVKGNTPVEWIQNAANDLAKFIKGKK